jgi:hypothetical protein
MIGFKYEWLSLLLAFVKKKGLLLTIGDVNEFGKLDRSNQTHRIQHKQMVESDY